MVTAVHIRTDESIEIDEFCETVAAGHDLSDRDEFLEAAPLLRKLANNKALFRRAALQTLKHAFEDPQVSVAPAYVVLSDFKYSDFTVRANLWPVLQPEVAESTRTLFSYDLKHDHTFSFLTANYFGPGYVTKIWTNPDASTEAMKIGDVANLVYQGEYQLTPDLILFFERLKDVHVQFPPAADSVSLNLVVNDPAERTYPQHAFELETGKIIGYPNGSPLRNKLVFMRLLGNSDDPNLIDILDWAVKRETVQVSREAITEARERIRARLAPV